MRIISDINQRLINTPRWPGTWGRGVYFILNTKTDRIYIGSSYQVGRRWRTHVSNLRKGKHPCRALQAEWDAYGHDAFVFYLAEEVKITGDLVARERVHQNDNRDRLYSQH